MKIELTQGKFCEVDAANFNWLNLFSWSAEKNGQTFYAKANIGGRTVRMHRYLCDTAAGFVTDHRNRNGLDNHIKNLRICSHTENMRNGHRTDGASRYRGVIRYGDKWQARIVFDGQRRSLGLYGTEGEAALAYNLAARRLFGEYAHLNIILEVGQTGELFGRGKL